MDRRFGSLGEEFETVEGGFDLLPRWKDEGNGDLSYGSIRTGMQSSNGGQGANGPWGVAGSWK